MKSYRFVSHIILKYKKIKEGEKHMIDIKTYNQAVEECTRFVQDPSNFMVKEHTHTSQQVEGLSSNLELLHQLDVKVKDHMNNETIHVTKEDKENWNSTFDRLEKYILQKFSEVDSLRIIVLGDGIGYKYTDYRYGCTCRRTGDKE